MKLEVLVIVAAVLFVVGVVILRRKREAGVAMVGLAMMLAFVYEVVGPD